MSWATRQPQANAIAGARLFILMFYATVLILGSLLAFGVLAA